MPDSNFKFDIEEASFFEKADNSKKTRHIGGIASIETKDRQNETLLQRGLDFSEFVDHGWFNDNHSKATEDVLGYPDSAMYFKKGDDLPNGKRANAPGHWVEGKMLNTKKANAIWDLAQDLQGTPRRLGFSVEGKIQKRDSLDKSTVTKALVREVAITKSPVNTDAQMDILAKSLATPVLEKTLTMGEPTPGEAVAGPKTGKDAGQVLAEEDLEDDEKDTNKALTDSQAFTLLDKRYPNISPEIKGRIITVTRELKQKSNL